MAEGEISFSQSLDFPGSSFFGCCSDLIVWETLGGRQVNYNNSSWGYPGPCEDSDAAPLLGAAWLLSMGECIGSRVYDAEGPVLSKVLHDGLNVIKASAVRRYILDNPKLKPLSMNSKCNL